MPDSKPVAIPGGGEMQLTECRNPLDRTQRQRLHALPRLRGAEDRRRLGGRAGAPELRDPGAAAGDRSRRPRRAAPPTRAPAKTSSNRTRRKPRWSSSARTAPTSPRSKSSDVLGKRYTTEKGIVVEWAPYRIGEQVWQLGLPERPPEGRPGAALRLDLAHHRETGGAHRPARSRPRAGSATVTHRRLAALALGRDEQLGALLAPFADLVQLRVGGSALHPRRPAAARTSRPRPRRSRSGRSQAASASGLGRIAGIRSWTLATTSFGRRGDDRAAVEPAVVEAAVLGVLPLLAGADAGEGEGLAAVDGEAPGLARLLGILRLHPLVEAVGDDQAAVAELADQRRVGAARGRGSRPWR